MFIIKIFKMQKNTEKIVLNDSSEKNDDDSTHNEKVGYRIDRHIKRFIHNFIVVVVHVHFFHFDLEKIK